MIEEQLTRFRGWNDQIESPREGKAEQYPDPAKRFGEPEMVDINQHQWKQHTDQDNPRQHIEQCQAYMIRSGE